MENCDKRCGICKRYSPRTNDRGWCLADTDEEAVGENDCACNWFCQKEAQQCECGESVCKDIWLTRDSDGTIKLHVREPEFDSWSRTFKSGEMLALNSGDAEGFDWLEMGGNILCDLIVKLKE